MDLGELGCDGRMWTKLGQYHIQREPAIFVVLNLRIRILESKFVTQKVGSVGVPLNQRRLQNLFHSVC
jgi:hypothetical protein